MARESFRGVELRFLMTPWKYLDFSSPVAKTVLIIEQWPSCCVYDVFFFFGFFEF